MPGSVQWHQVIDTDPAHDLEVMAQYSSDPPFQMPVQVATMHRHREPGGNGPSDHSGASGYYYCSHWMNKKEAVLRSLDAHTVLIIIESY